MRKFMVVKKLLGLILAGSLMACSTHYLKPGTTRQDYERDYESCWRQSAPPKSLMIPAALFFGPAALALNEQQKSRTRDCMQAQGYTVGGDSGYKHYE